MEKRRKWTSSVFCLLISCLISKQTTAEKILLLYDGNQTTHIEAYESIKTNLKKNHIIDLVNLEDTQSIKNTDTQTLTIALGLNALKTALTTETTRAIAVSLISQENYRDIINTSLTLKNIQHGVVFIDQPIKRQLEIAETLLPNLRKIGALEKKNQPDDLINEDLRDSKITFITQDIDSQDNIIQAAESLFVKVDAVLALPDQDIYNQRTIHGFLLSAYRNRVPIIGYSEPFVRAGAVFSAYTTPEMLGKQTAKLAEKLLLIPADKSNQIILEYPEEYLVATNSSIARALGLTLRLDDLNKKN